MDLKWLLFGILMAFDGLFLAAVISKYVEVKRASIWAATPGKIVSSRSEAREIKIVTGSGRQRVERKELRNFAAVTYSFQADGQRQTGSRISIGADLGNFQVAEKLQRYPVGTAVTVFYDRNRPSDNVLERDMSMRSFEVAILVGILIGLGGLFLVLITDGTISRIAGMVPHSGNTSASFFLAVMGVLMVGFGYAIYQRGAATYGWPRASGIILSSEVDAMKTHFRRRAYIFTSRRLFRARTIYSYTVQGVSYRGDQTSFGAQSYASFRLFAERGAARFTPGQPIEVYYNPDAPEQAVLRPGAPGQWLIWIAAAAFFAIAARLSGVI